MPRYRRRRTSPGQCHPHHPGRHRPHHAGRPDRRSAPCSPRSAPAQHAGTSPQQAAQPAGADGSLRADLRLQV